MTRFVWSVCAFVALLSTASCSWTVFIKPTTEARDVQLDMDTVKDLVFFDGMVGPEGIWADRDGMKLWVTDCSGMIYALDGANRKSLKVVDSKKIAAASALGVTVGQDSMIYVGIADTDWLTGGGYIARMSQTFSDKEVLTDTFEGLNGMDFSPNGDLYFATSNMSYKHGAGKIFKLPMSAENNSPVPVLEDLGVANGLGFHPTDSRLYFTEVFSGVTAYDLKTQKRESVLAKADTFEFFDDICFDSKGRVWSTAAAGFLKTRDPQTGTSIRFSMEGIGSTSACAVRMENGEEIIYITELKKPGNRAKSSVYDGRGMVSFPLSVLEEYL